MTAACPCSPEHRTETGHAGLSLTTEIVSSGVSQTSIFQYIISIYIFLCFLHYVQWPDPIKGGTPWSPHHCPPSTSGTSKVFFLPFLPPECKARLLGLGPARLLPALYPHRLLVPQGPLPGFAPLMFFVSYRNNQPAPVHMSIETSEQWVKSAPQENIV